LPGRLLFLLLKRRREKKKRKNKRKKPSASRPFQRGKKKRRGFSLERGRTPSQRGKGSWPSHSESGQLAVGGVFLRGGTWLVSMRRGAVIPWGGRKTSGRVRGKGEETERVAVFARRGKGGLNAVISHFTRRGTCNIGGNLKKKEERGLLQKESWERGGESEFD